MNKFQKIGASILGLKAAVPNYLINTGVSFDWKDFTTKKGQLEEGYTNKIVYAVVNVLVSKLIEPPILVSKKKNKNKIKALESFSYGGNANLSGRANILKIKALEELEEHALLRLLETPNEYQTGIELKEAFWFNYELTGDGVLFVELSEGVPVFIHNLQRDRVTIKREGNDWRKPVTSYEYRAWDGTLVPLPFEQVMHLSKWTPLDPIRGGFSPQQAVGSTIAKNNANEEAQGAAYVNGGTGIIISSDIVIDNGKAHSKLSKEQVESIKKTVKEDIAGVRNAKKIHVTNGHVNVQKLGDTLVDLEAIAADDQDAQRIASAWGVNPILIGDMNKGTESNVAAAYKALVTNVVVARLRRFDAKFRQFSKTWYPKEDLYVAHDLTEFSELAPDLKLMYEVFGKVSWLTYNEIRKLFNFDESTVPQMNRFIVPMGLTFIEDIGVDSLGEPEDDEEL